jgi:HAD superfamily hydrolase (TIGR01549 family)
MSLTGGKKIRDEEKKSIKRATIVAFDLLNTLVEIARPNPLFEIRKEFKIQKEEMDFIFLFENAMMKRKFESLESLFTEFCKPFDIEPTRENIGKMIEIWKMGLEGMRFFPEVPGVLSKLKKKEMKMALLSNIDSSSYKYVLERFRLQEYFDLMLPSYETHCLKPHPMAFSNIMLKMQTPSGQIVMVGDTLESDIRMAKTLGMNAVLVDRNSSNKNEDIISIQNLEELITLLAKE